jgi:hypothetical protein
MIGFGRVGFFEQRTFEFSYGFVGFAKAGTEGDPRHALVLSTCWQAGRCLPDAASRRAQPEVMRQIYRELL